MPCLMMWWTAIRHLSATAELWVVWSRSIRSSTVADAVARGPSPEERRAERCLCEGGVEASWVVARRRERFV